MVVHVERDGGERETISTRAQRKRDEREEERAQMKRRGSCDEKGRDERGRLSKDRFLSLLSPPPLSSGFSFPSFLLSSNQVTVANS